MSNIVLNTISSDESKDKSFFIGEKISFQINLLNIEYDRYYKMSIIDSHGNPRYHRYGKTESGKEELNVKWRIPRCNSHGTWKVIFNILDTKFTCNNFEVNKYDK